MRPETKLDASLAFRSSRLTGRTACDPLRGIVLFWGEGAQVARVVPYTQCSRMAHRKKNPPKGDASGN